MSKSATLSTDAKLPVIAATLLLLMFPLFFYFGPGSHPARSLRLIWNLGHIGFFALFTYCLHFYWKGLQQRHYFSQLVIVLLIVLIVGIVIELAQGLAVNREMDIMDLVKNLIGSLLGLFFIRSWRNQLNSRLKWSSKALLLLILLWQLYPLSQALLDEHRASQQFPLLADFEHALELQRWSAGEQNANLATLGQFSLKVSLAENEQYPGVSFDYFPADWREYNYLLMDIFNPHQTMLQLTVRINDRQHNQRFGDRFNRSINLSKGWNQVSIDIDDIVQAPSGRLMDLQEISKIMLFSVKQKKNRELYLDNIRLR